jgi:hypothetical protein
VSALVHPVATDETMRLTPAARRKYREGAACKCASEEHCEIHEFVCPCASRFGTCTSRRCWHCCGSSVVSREDAGLDRCARCAAQDVGAKPAGGLGGLP